MDGWKAVLQESFLTTKATADQSIETVRTRFKNLPMKHCVYCGAKCLTGDLLDLKCVQKSSDPGKPAVTVTHLHCFDCLQDRLERQQGHNEKHLSAERSTSKNLDNVVICTQCHSPAVVIRTSGFVSGFQQKQGGGTGRVQFRLLEDVTQSVRQNTVIMEYYQNQRRRPFSRFANWLLPSDTRTLESNANGDPVKRDVIDRLQPGEVWLNSWTCDSSEGDPQGWKYAFNWPDHGVIKWGTWTNAPSAGTFVRRRRQIRTKIRLEDLDVGQSEAGSPREDFSPSSNSAGNFGQYSPRDRSNSGPESRSEA